MLDVEGGEIPSRTDGPNPADLAVRGGDDTRTGLRIGASHPWREAWAVEVAYVDLGDAVAFIGDASASAGDVLEAAENLHPQTGYGLSLGAVRHWEPEGPIRLELGGGLWSWRSEWSVSAGGRERDYHRTGVDLYTTLAASMAVHDRLRLRTRWDRYRLDGGDADSFALELVYRFQ